MAKKCRKRKGGNLKKEKFDEMAAEALKQEAEGKTKPFPGDGIVPEPAPDKAIAEDTYYSLTQIVDVLDDLKYTWERKLQLLVALSDTDLTKCAIILKRSSGGVDYWR